MTILQLGDLETPIGQILAAASADGVLLEDDQRTRYAVLPLDDELLDFLLERSPKFISDCQQIRAEMQRGKLHSHEEVKKLLAG